MKSGHRQKLVLNMLNTALMIEARSRVKGNRMVDMQLSNNKLVGPRSISASWTSWGWATDRPTNCCATTAASAGHRHAVTGSDRKAHGDQQALCRARHRTVLELAAPLYGGGGQTIR